MRTIIDGNTRSRLGYHTFLAVKHLCDIMPFTCAHPTIRPSTLMQSLCSSEAWYWLECAWKEFWRTSGLIWKHWLWWLFSAS